MPSRRAGSGLTSSLAQAPVLRRYAHVRDPGRGIIKPNGYFILTATGAIYYRLSDGGYLRFPGAATIIAPVTGGFFILRHRLTKNDSQLSFFDYGKAQFRDVTVWAASLVSGRANVGPWTQLYAVDSANRIWTTPITWWVKPTISDVFSDIIQPEGIAAGPDGAIWFANTYYSQIGSQIGGSVWMGASSSTRRQRGTALQQPLPAARAAPCGLRRAEATKSAESFLPTAA